MEDATDLNIFILCSTTQLQEKVKKALQTTGLELVQTDGFEAAHDAAAQKEELHCQATHELQPDEQPQALQGAPWASRVGFVPGPPVHPKQLHTQEVQFEEEHTTLLHVQALQFPPEKDAQFPPEKELQFEHV